MVSGYLCFTELHGVLPLFGIQRRWFFGILFGALGCAQIVPAALFAATDIRLFAFVGALANALLSVLCVFLFGVGLFGLLFQVGMPFLTWKWFNEMSESPVKRGIDADDVTRRVALLLISGVVFVLAGPYLGLGLWAFANGAGGIPPPSPWAYLFGFAPASTAGVIFGFFLALSPEKWIARSIERHPVRTVFMFGWIGMLAGFLGCAFEIAPPYSLRSDNVSFWIESYVDLLMFFGQFGIPGGAACGAIMVWPTKKLSDWRHARWLRREVERAQATGSERI
jgi:hypothetical protein